jgi:SSS family transporter
MHWVDWIVLTGVMSWIVYDGLRRTKDNTELEGYFLAKRSIPWWAAGLSVMATQLSAITMIGTTGQGYTDGMRFIQFYFALPVAMVLLSVTLVPFFYNSGVYTAYEYLEKRFDAKTRSLTSLLFLISRGMSCGAAVAAPAVVMSLILDLSVTTTSLLIVAPAVAYTMFGGVQAVTWTDVKIMVLIVFGLLVVIVTALLGYPSGIGPLDGLTIAGATGRLQTFDFSLDLTNQYTFWSGTIAALFLFCSYFGTDQSQVQRYLTARSVDHARRSLLMSAYWKIPLQVLVLLLGVIVFTFHVFHAPPLIFSSTADQRVREAAPSEYAALERQHATAVAARREAATAFAAASNAAGSQEIEGARSALRAGEAAVEDVRTRARDLVRKTTGESSFTDVNYIVPSFILTHVPVGLVGLLIVAVILAATDTIAGELNSLSTATVIDFYRRWAVPVGNDAHYLMVSKLATGAWGLFACGVAVWAAELGSLIEVVNRFGSFFYGSVLGVFILALAVPWATGTGAFVGLAAGMSVVAWFAAYSGVAFLWHNVIGAVTVVVVGAAISLMSPRSASPPTYG